MRDYLEVFKVGSEEYKQLDKVCEYLNDLANDTHFHFEIRTMYFDRGQEWWYTGIICCNDSRDKNDVCYSYQFFCPRDHARLFYDTWESIETMLEDKVDELIVKSMK